MKLEKGLDLLGKSHLIYLMFSTGRFPPAFVPFTLAAILLIRPDHTEASPCSSLAEFGGQQNTLEDPTKLSILGFEATVSYISAPEGMLL